MATTKKTSTKTIKKATRNAVAAEQMGNYGHDEIAKVGGGECDNFAGESSISQ